MSNLHYTKSGALDMRYSSSKAAMSSGSYSGGSSSSTNYSSTSSDLHYTKSGALDMRYSSSKAAVSSGNDRGLFSSSAHYFPASSDLHYKKDGTLDMRYGSSKQTVASSEDLNYKKDGSLDMRFASSKKYMDSSSLRQGIGRMTISNSVDGIPSHIPVTKQGLPDMRTSAAKSWIALEAERSTGLPNWLPRLKDGSIDMKKSVTQEFLSKRPTCSIQQNIYIENRRATYYENKLNKDSDFSYHIKRVRREIVPSPNYDVQPIPPSRVKLAESLRGSLQSPSVDVANVLGSQTDLVLIDNSEINFGAKEELGRGAFGVVFKGVWKGKTVAVKQLHLQQLTVKEKRSFVNEVTILGLVSQHNNLVILHGYTLEPLGIVLEFVGLGSLSSLLHYNEKPEIEAKMTDGRIKKNLVVDIVKGMIHLHGHKIVHGDLKPQNILVSNDYVAKITDFGLSSIRGKTSATVASKNLTNEEGCGGTAGYMDPVLLDSVHPPGFHNDVYSFGILFNEIIEEEEPYSDQYRNFLGRGPYAAANYAKLGKRPNMTKKIPNEMKLLIQNCWDGSELIRPTFEKILKDLKKHNMEIPNSCV